MIDLETKSDIDIAKSGVYRYADSPYFDILLFAYSVDDTPVQVVDLACGEQLPEEILNALTDDRIQKHAFNASFERVCLSVWLRRNYPERFVSYGSQEDACGNYLNPNAWRCTMVAAAYLGLPLSLAGVGAVLQLQQQKMSEGKCPDSLFLRAIRHGERHSGVSCSDRCSEEMGRLSGIQQTGCGNGTSD